VSAEGHPEKWNSGVAAPRIQYTINDRRNQERNRPFRQRNKHQQNHAEAHAEPYGHTNANSRFNCGEITDAKLSAPAEISRALNSFCTLFAVEGRVKFVSQLRADTTYRCRDETLWSRTTFLEGFLISSASMTERFSAGASKSDRQIAFSFFDIVRHEYASRLSMRFKNSPVCGKERMKRRTLHRAQ